MLARTGGPDASGSARPTAASDFVWGDTLKSPIGTRSCSSRGLVAQGSLTAPTCRHSSVRISLLTTHAGLAEPLAPFSVRSQPKLKDRNKKKTGIAVQDLETHLTEEKKKA